MRIQKIEEYFKSEDTLNEVLEECSEEFKSVDYYAGIMKKGIVDDNPAEAKSALSKLTGVYMNLKTILAIAETEKKNRETRYYDQKRIDTENAEKKFVSASTEKEASAYVASYRRIRNIIEAYVDACLKAIVSLQSLLKYMTIEHQIKGNVEEE